MTAHAAVTPAVIDWRRDAIATMGGLLMALGSSPYNYWWLSVAALAALCLCSVGTATNRAFRLAFLFGLAQFSVIMYLIYRGTLNLVETPDWLRAVTAMSLVFFQALFPAAAALLSVFLAQRSRLFLFYVYFPVLWALFDSARQMTVYEFPWELLGYVYQSNATIEFKIALWAFVPSLYTVTIAAVASVMVARGLRAIRRRQS
jgi:apolipoprotein N-acyltransferase